MGNGRDYTAMFPIGTPTIDLWEAVKNLFAKGSANRGIETTLAPFICQNFPNACGALENTISNLGIPIVMIGLKHGIFQVSEQGTGSNAKSFRHMGPAFIL